MSWDPLAAQIGPVRILRENQFQFLCPTPGRGGTGLRSTTARQARYWTIPSTHALKSPLMPNILPEESLLTCGFCLWHSLWSWLCSIKCSSENMHWIDRLVGPSFLASSLTHNTVGAPPFAKGGIHNVCRTMLVRSSDVKFDAPAEPIPQNSAHQGWTRYERGFSPPLPCSKSTKAHYNLAYTMPWAPGFK